MLSSVFSGLSRVELAHVRRCQSIAVAEHLSVVSSGVLASPAAGAPAGAHFWLVGSPSSGAISFVWLSASGRRLLCGCPRRRGGALSCAHAQCVRFWLLSAAGVAVPSFGLGASAPVPPSPAGPVAALPVPVAPVASCVSPSVVVPSSPAPFAPAGEPVCPCPGCGELAPVAVVAPFGVCVSCLDLEAEAAGVPSPARCPVHPWVVASGESASGLFCALCESDARWEAGFTLEYSAWQPNDIDACCECGAPADFLTHYGPLCGSCAAKHLAQFSSPTEARMHEMVAEAERAEEEAAAANDPNRQMFLPDRSKPEEV